MASNDPPAALSRESGLALIADANRWQAAYTRERDRVAKLEEGLWRVRSLLATGAPVPHVIEIIEEVEVDAAS